MFRDCYCFEHKIYCSWKQIPNLDAFITTQEFNKLTTDNFKERLKQANLVSINYFDNKLISFPQIKNYKKITSNKAKYLEVQKKLNSLKTKEYNVSIGRVYFIGNDDFHKLVLAKSAQEPFILNTS